MGSPERPRAKPIEGHIAHRKRFCERLDVCCLSYQYIQVKKHYIHLVYFFRHNVRNQLTRLYFTRKFDQEVNAFVIEELTA